MPRAKKIVRLWGNWSEEELQRAFDEIKFANCSVNAVSKEHGIPGRALKDYLIFSSIKSLFQRLALLPTPLALLPSRAFNNANCNDFTF